MKIAFIFSGQGSQYNGMGQELYNNFPIVKDIFNLADNELNFKISEMCFKENKELHFTRNTQPAIYTLSYAISELLKKENIIADYLAGLSLGEYSALSVSGAIDFSDCVKLVNKRGIIMEQAVPNGIGTMSAIMGLNKILVEESCMESQDMGIVSIANYNTKDQLVISGEINAVKKASEIALSKGAKRVINLNVSGPFHTILLEEASKFLNKELDNIKFSDIKIPVISNNTAKEYPSKESIKDLLTNQIKSSVRWEESINYLIQKGVDTFIEIGPSKTLSSFVKSINKNVKILNIENLNSFEKTLNELK